MCGVLIVLCAPPLPPPSYKEDLAVISASVDAAMEADLPPGVTRTLYLCDDGKVGGGLQGGHGTGWSAASRRHLLHTVN